MRHVDSVGLVMGFRGRCKWLVIVSCYWLGVLGVSTFRPTVISVVGSPQKVNRFAVIFEPQQITGSL